MEPREIYISEFDLARLLKLFDAEIRKKDRVHLASLKNELDRAHVMDPAAIPDDIVTMNSRVRLEDLVAGGEWKDFTLVFPPDANIGVNRISILAPVGTAILGRRVGDTVEWKVPAGRRRLQIKELLFQPEAAGRHYL